MQQIRGRKVAMILQDPMSSLNPVFSIGMQVREAAGMYHALRGKALSERAAALLAAVRIPSPAARLCAPSRTSSRAACASAWWAPWPSRRRRGCSSRTSRRPASTSRSRRSISGS